MSETNAEFLERMKRKAYTKMIFLAVQVDMPDLKRLIEQAERVQELESICESLKIEWRDGVLENKRLREASEQLK